jgi:hypothetical protein
VASRHLSAADLDRLFEPASYVGMAAAFVDRVLSSAEHRRATGTGRDTATDAGVARPPEAEQLAPRIRTVELPHDLFSSGRTLATSPVPFPMPAAHRVFHAVCHLRPSSVLRSSTLLPPSTSAWCRRVSSEPGREEAQCADDKTDKLAEQETNP